MFMYIKTLCNIIFLLLIVFYGTSVSAAPLYGVFDSTLSCFQYILEKALFIEVFHIPLIVLILISGSIFCTLRFRFVNVRFFKHAISILINDNNQGDSVGEINHFQAFATAIAGTIGLGTIAGVAVAVSIGGPGAVMWMMVAGFLGMSSKFVEVTLGFKYRVQDSKQHHVFGGPFQYIKKGLAELGLARLGKFLALSYSVLLIFAALGASIPFQANQTIAIITGYSSWVDGHLWVFALLLTLIVSLVILGGIKRVANVSSALVPIMAVIYISSCVVIVIVNFNNLGLAFKEMLYGMVYGNSILGGFMGAFIAGTRRAVFANEAGIGTASIAHASTKDSVGVRAGFVAMLEPCIDTMVICFLTGLVITVTGVYNNGDVTQEGILLTRDAFSTVATWFPIFLSISVPFFAFSTMITFAYYCEMGWLYLFKTNHSIVYCRILILAVVFFSSISHNFMTIAKLGDMLFMCLAIPNIIAMCLLSNKVGKELSIYRASLNKG